MEHVAKTWQPCTQCDNWFETEQFLTIHLATKHKMKRSPALQLKASINSKVDCYTSSLTKNTLVRSLQKSRTEKKIILLIEIQVIT